MKYDSDLYLMAAGVWTVFPLPVWWQGSGLKQHRNTVFFLSTKFPVALDYQIFTEGVKLNLCLQWLYLGQLAF